MHRVFSNLILLKQQRNSVNDSLLSFAGIIASYFVTVEVLMLVGFTAMPVIFEMLNGRSVEWDDSHLFVSVIANDMTEVKDGRVYFTLDNSDIRERG